MALFQNSVLKDHLRLQQEDQVEKAYKIFTSFLFYTNKEGAKVASSVVATGTNAVSSGAGGV